MNAHVLQHKKRGGTLGGSVDKERGGEEKKAPFPTEGRRAPLCGPMLGKGKNKPLTAQEEKGKVPFSGEERRGVVGLRCQGT